MQGTVVKSTGSWYRVRRDDGTTADARIRGRFRKDGLNTTNPVAVGDRVECIPESDSEQLVITEILPRRNYIIRRSNNLSRQRQILAANLDQAALLITLVAPATSTGFIDRFLVTCEAYHIPALLVINKCDLLEGSEELLEDFASMYKGAGYAVCFISALNGTGVDTLREHLEGKCTLLIGHSGTGKTTLINRLIPGLDLKTSAISVSHEKGRHTTTFAEMHFLPAGGAMIDTPGIRDLGVVDLEPQEIAHYFPEMRALMSQCRFNNCMHVNEPGCAVQAALEKGSLSEERYYNYLSILRNEDVFR
jgi:ribosome biogenesis GTPase / thiamine phosphate phosphatase